MKKWLSFAKMDLDSALFLEKMYPAPLEIICYHSQQCAEKALKSYLVLHDFDFPKTHDLKKLCSLCATFDTSFNLIDCETLTIYGVAPRYPFTLELDEAQAKKAVSDAAAIFEFIKAKCHL